MAPKIGQLAGPSNPNWKGGRTVTQHGYVLVKMPDHPMADCRGYVYEHRLIAAEREGRLLTSTEQVHHDDRIRTNNAQGNLIVKASAAEHHVHHRKRADLRMPGEPNPVIDCACGCGRKFDRYDCEGRPRRFVSGHNKRQISGR